MVQGTLLNITWMGGGFGGEWIHVHVCLSPFTVHLKPSQHVHRLYLKTKSKVQKKNKS